jgi:hypothetical protein
MSKRVAVNSYYAGKVKSEGLKAGGGVPATVSFTNGRFVRLTYNASVPPLAGAPNSFCAVSP